jgi:AcrR family transcriptional regulator
MATPDLESSTGSHPTPSRERLVEAAAKVYGELGFRGATTRRIAEEAGVNEVTLFRTFGSKAALIIEVMHRNLGDGRAKALPEVPVDPLAELTAWATGYMAHATAHRGMIMQAMGEIFERPEILEPMCDARDREFARIRGYFEALRARGIATAAFDATTVAAMFIGALFSDAVGREHFPGTFGEPAEQAPAEYARLILRAIGADPDAPPRARATPASSPASEH